MKIRPYLPKDKKAVIQLLELNTPTFFAESEKEDLNKYLNQEIEDYFVAEENNEIIGAGGINYFPEEKTARFSWDIIKPNAQWKGVGTKLIKYRIELLKKKKRIALIKLRTSQLAYSFYEKKGFKLVKIKKDFWAKGFDLYQMELKNKT